MQITTQANHRLLKQIVEEIKTQGPITFARYMELALYAPGLGYYSAGAKKFGAGGDFVTAPEISPLFSRCIAHQCQQVLAHINGGDILEIGAGSGVMAVDILIELEKSNTLPNNYFILELSADLKQRQQELLQQKIPHLFNRIHWLNTLNDLQTQGVILANEVLDAMPIHKFKIDHGIKEFYADYKNDKLSWHVDKPSNTELTKAIEQLTIEFGENYESEINLLLKPWIKSLSDVLKSGLILLLDYGFPRHEYYHPDRNQGTLMCHYQHQAHSDPLLNPGLQDITAHVDFTAVAEAADMCDLRVAGYTTQGHFLVNCGLLNLIADNTGPATQWQISQQIKKLLMPSEMGELVKTIALTRNLDMTLLGFTANDKRDRL
jgi:SAM-dependent MidA family methyltransferase